MTAKMSQRMRLEILSLKYIFLPEPQQKVEFRINT